jgi:protein gp37
MPFANRRMLVAEKTEISWADATFNPWIGCTRVSPACDNCYAARDNERRHWVDGWGTGVPRRRTKTWGDPIRWNKQATLTGNRLRVFCASLADVFDNEVDPSWRADLFELIRKTPNLRWMLLTKRIGNAAKMLPFGWTCGDYNHVGLMATLENQEVWDRDYPKLASTPAVWRGVSAEPLLSQINIGDAKLDWIITGGESGAQYRFTDVRWVRSLRDQCARNGIAYHHKQWGGTRPKENGCMLDGREHKDFPKALMA